MRDFSLIYLPCKKYMLCGISTSFPVLSPSHRQVAHALLTRPPLDNGGKPPLSRSTWMCYARRQRSSWARIKLSSVFYYHMLFACHNLKPEFPFASFEFSRSFLPSCVLLGIVEILLCLVVQFSRTISLSLHLSFLLPSLSKAPHRTAWLFYHISYPFVNPFLKKNFFPFLFRLPPTSPPPLA